MGGLLSWLQNNVQIGGPPHDYSVQPSPGLGRLQLPQFMQAGGASALASPAAAATAAINPQPGLSAPPLAPPGQTPMARDATGDAQPAGYTPPADVSYRGPNGILKGNAYSYAGGAPATLTNAPGNFGGGQLGADRRTVLGLPPAVPAASTAAPATTAVPTPPVTPAAAAVAGGGSRGGFRFHDLSPLAAQAIAAFMPRQQMPIEQVQQHITDMANTMLKSKLDSLGRAPSAEEYKAIMDNYAEWTKPVSLGVGLPQMYANQFGGGAP